MHCAGGYRSVIAASILKARGYSKVIDVAGGYGAIKKTKSREHKQQLVLIQNNI